MFYIESTKSLSVGDKIANRFGAKGIVSHIIPPENSCYGEYTKHTTDLDIEVFLAPSSLLGRKNLVVLKELYIGKLLYLLPYELNDVLAKSVSAAKNYILRIYMILD